MLVQHRADVLRLVTQHDHAYISGELARAWGGPEDDERLSLDVILASALHDLSWRDLDRIPLYDPEKRLPHDFTTYPREMRREATARGLREAAELHPHVGALVALHYQRLGIEIPPTPEPMAPPERILDEPRVRRDSDFLRLFDNLSLFLCLTPPGSGPGGHYDWLLAPERLRMPGRSGLLAAKWRDSETLALAPFPFGSRPLELEMPCRDLPRESLAPAEAMENAWRSTPLRRIPLHLVDSLS